MGKAVLHFQVPIEIECPFLIQPDKTGAGCTKGLMKNNLEYCVQHCNCTEKRVIVNGEESLIKEGW